MRLSLSIKSTEPCVFVMKAVAVASFGGIIPVVDAVVVVVVV